MIGFQVYHNDVYDPAASVPRVKLTIRVIDPIPDNCLESTSSFFLTSLQARQMAKDLQLHAMALDMLVEGS